MRRAQGHDGGARFARHLPGGHDDGERAVLQKHQTGRKARLVERLLQPQLALVVGDEALKLSGGLCAGVLIRRVAVQKRV